MSGWLSTRAQDADSDVEIEAAGPNVEGVGQNPFTKFELRRAKEYADSLASRKRRRRADVAAPESLLQPSSVARTNGPHSASALDEEDEEDAVRHPPLQAPAPEPAAAALGNQWDPIGIEGDSGEDGGGVDDAIAPESPAVRRGAGPRMRKLASIGTGRPQGQTAFAMRQAPRAPPPMAVNSGEEEAGSGEDWSGEEEEVDVDEVLREVLGKCASISSELRASVRRLFRDGGGEAAVTNAEAQGWYGGDRGLKQYQLLGLNWLWLLHRNDTIHGVLADEMGLGKTVQALALLRLLAAREGVQGPHLVIAPASTLENWSREAAMWCPNHRVATYHGPQSERRQLRRELRKHRVPQFDILLTTYTFFERETAGDDRKWLRKLKFEYAILDEAHCVKDFASARYRRLLANIRSRRRLLLSGTPLQNNLMELLALLSFTLPSLFDIADGRIVRLFREWSEDRSAESRRLRRVRRILAPFMLRRLKDDVLGELVPKEERVIFLDLPKGQREVYDAVVRRAAEARAGTAALEAGMPRAKARFLFTELRKAANHGLLVRHRVRGERLREVVGALYRAGAFGDECTREQAEEEVDGWSDFEIQRMCADYAALGPPLSEVPMDGPQVEEASVKLRYLHALLPRLQRAGHRCLVFSQWTRILDIMEVTLTHHGQRFIRLDGSTPVGTRQSLIDEFEEDEDIGVFLVSTRAGGLGINLTAADVVILHDSDFNPTNDRQAMDRCHRMGQTKPVRVYRLVAKDTVDEKILRLCLRKSHVSEHVLDANTLAKRALARTADAAASVKEEGEGGGQDAEEGEGEGAEDGAKSRADESERGEKEEEGAASEADGAQGGADSAAEDGADEDVAIAEDAGIEATAVSSNNGSLAAQILGQEAAAAAAREGERNGPDGGDDDEDGAGEGVAEDANAMMELLGSELARLTGAS